MTGDLEPYGAGAGFDLDVIRDQFAPAASRLELEYFALVCRHLELDPWAGHIYLIGRRQKFSEHGRDVWRLVHKPQIAVAGRRAIASRTGRLVGIDGPYWCGPRRLDPAGGKLPLDWTDVWDDDDNFPYQQGFWCGRPAGGLPPTAPSNGRSSRCMTTPSAPGSAASGNTRRRTCSAKWPNRSPCAVGSPKSRRPSCMWSDPATMSRDDTAIIAEAEAGPEAARLANQASQSTFDRPPAQPADDSPPPDYYDALPEAAGHQPGDGYRYDPNPGQRFTE